MDRDASTESRLYVKSLEKSLLLLGAFDGRRQYLSEAEIARSVGLHRSSVQRLVHTLECLGYLKRHPDQRGYALTQKVLRLSNNYLRTNPIIRQAWPHILDLNRGLKETINLHELDGADIVFIARVRRRNLEHMDLAVGSRLPAFCTASGTAILAHLPEEQRHDILRQSRLERRTPFTEIRPEALLRRLERTRQAGYAVLANESVIGDISIGAPILNRQRIAVAGLSISVSTRIWTPERVEADLSGPILAATAAIAAALQE